MSGWEVSCNCFLCGHEEPDFKVCLSSQKNKPCTQIVPHFISSFAHTHPEGFIPNHCHKATLQVLRCEKNNVVKKMPQPNEWNYSMHYHSDRIKHYHVVDLKITVWRGMLFTIDSHYRIISSLLAQVSIFHLFLQANQMYPAKLKI